MPRKPEKHTQVSTLDCLRYIALLYLLGALLGLSLFIIAEFILDFDRTAERALIAVAGLTAGAILQRHLILRCLRLDLRSWAHWTILGGIVGYACYLIYREAVPHPSAFYWNLRFQPPPEPADMFVIHLYHSLADFLRYGLVAFFQYRALPRHLPGRRLWLLTAVIAAALWQADGSLTFLLRATAMIHIATGFLPIPSALRRRARPPLAPAADLAYRTGG